MKLARNALGTFKAFKDQDDNLIEWRFMDQLVTLQSSTGFKLANKLSSTHMHWRSNSMKVKLAVQTLSSSVADALQFLQRTTLDFKKCEATIHFIRVIDEVFDFLNSRNPFAKGFKQPITSANYLYLETKMNDNIKYLYSLKQINGKPLWMSKRRTFIIGFATAIKSVLLISKVLLLKNFKYILTYKFSQDAIELLLGHFRGRYGCNNNPNCLQFKYAIRSLLLHNSIKMSSGNCTLLIPKNDSLFTIKWRHKDTVENNYEIDNHIQMLIDNSCNHQILNALTENILYYICGYIVKKIIPEIKCENFIESISEPSIMSYELDHTYNQISINSYKTFNSLKNRGGLKMASESVFKIIQLTEQYFRSLIIDKKTLLI